jgi:hypothetical protein
MSITETLAAALVTDLQTVSGIAEVGREPKRIDEALAPSAYVITADGSSDIETISNMQGQCRQSFVVQLMVRSAAPNADMNSLLDAVRNAVESSSGTLVTLSTVVRVSVTRWSGVFTEPSIHEGVYLREVTVDVDYIFTRGSA